MPSPDLRDALRWFASADPAAEATAETAMLIMDLIRAGLVVRHVDAVEVRYELTPAGRAVLGEV